MNISSHCRAGGQGGRGTGIRGRKAGVEGAGSGGRGGGDRGERGAGSFYKSVKGVRHVLIVGLMSSVRCLNRH